MRRRQRRWDAWKSVCRSRSATPRIKALLARHSERNASCQPESNSGWRPPPPARCPRGARCGSTLVLRREDRDDDQSESPFCWCLIAGSGAFVGATSEFPHPVRIIECHRSTRPAPDSELRLTPCLRRTRGRRPDSQACDTIGRNQRRRVSRGRIASRGPGDAFRWRTLDTPAAIRHLPGRPAPNHRSHPPTAPTCAVQLRRAARADRAQPASTAFLPAKGEALVIAGGAMV